MSVGSWMAGSGTSSTRTSSTPCQVSALIGSPRRFGKPSGCPVDSAVTTRPRCLCDMARCIATDAVRRRGLRPDVPRLLCGQRPDVRGARRRERTGPREPPLSEVHVSQTFPEITRASPLAVRPLRRRSRRSRGARRAVRATSSPSPAAWRCATCAAASRSTTSSRSPTSACSRRCAASSRTAATRSPRSPSRRSSASSGAPSATPRGSPTSRAPCRSARRASATPGARWSRSPAAPPRRQGDRRVDPRAARGRARGDPRDGRHELAVARRTPARRGRGRPRRPARRHRPELRAVRGHRGDPQCPAHALRPPARGARAPLRARSQAVGHRASASASPRCRSHGCWLLAWTACGSSSNTRAGRAGRV